MTRSARIIFVIAGVVVALHILGAVYAHHIAWGFHLFGFYSPVAALVTLGLSIAFFVPAVQSAVGNGLETLVGKLSRIPLKIVTLLLIGIVAGLGALFTVELHLLGDSAILLRSIPKSAWGEEVISSFRNQPLLNEIYRWAMNINPSGQMTNPKEVYQVINLVSAGLLVMLTVWFVRALPRPPVERVLLGFLLFTSAGTQFFFGYVENYVLQYVATAAFAVTGWLALEGRIHIAIPLIVLALLPGFNLGTGIFLPAALFLVLYRFRDQKVKALAITGGLGVVGILVLLMIGFDFTAFIDKFTSGSVDFLPILGTSAGIYAYRMFSAFHLLDWFNAATLIFPFGLFIPAVLFFSFPKGERWNNPTLVFLLILSACGILFTWIINFALGMARDWDNISSFFVPLVILNIYMLAKAPNLEPRRSVLVLVCALSFLHLAGFIGINADAEKHMARMKTLNDTRLLSRYTQMTYDEALANYFFGLRNYPEAKIYYEHYMTIDSSNTRIIGNISDVYRKLGENDKYFYQLQRGVRLNSPNSGMYSNLGVEYANRGDTGKAIYWNAKAIEIDSNNVNAHANIGILYLSKKDYVRANFHFATAIRQGMRNARLFLFAAESAMFSQDFVRALGYYDSYVEWAPNDTANREKRDRLRELLIKDGVIR